MLSQMSAVAGSTGTSAVLRITFTDAEFTNSNQVFVMVSEYSGGGDVLTKEETFQAILDAITELATGTVHVYKDNSTSQLQ